MRADGAGNKTERTVTFDAIKRAGRAWNGACHTNWVGQLLGPVAPWHISKLDECH
jgi:hypothetical protein